jgi:hypothetical protein
LCSGKIKQNTSGLRELREELRMGNTTPKIGSAKLDPLPLDCSQDTGGQIYTHQAEV